MNGERFQRIIENNPKYQCRQQCVQKIFVSTAENYHCTSMMISKPEIYYDPNENYEQDFFVTIARLGRVLGNL